MIQLVVHNNINNNKKVFTIEKMYDFAEMSKVYGPVINSIIGQFRSVRPACDAIAEYLSNGHLDVEVLDPEDNEEIYDPNVDISEKHPTDAKSVIDLKDMLETYDKSQYVDIHERHVLDGASHRDGSTPFVKSESLQKDRGRITFPADPKITNRPDQEVKPTSLTSQKYAEKRIQPDAKGQRNISSVFSNEAGGLHVNTNPPLSLDNNINVNTKEHEGFHALTDLISRKHGEVKAGHFVNHLVSKIDPMIHDMVHESLMNTPGYKEKHNHSDPSERRGFQEEKLAFLRDFVSNTDSRHNMKSFFEGNPDMGNFNDFDAAAKKSWRDVLEASSKYKIPGTLT